MKKQNDIILNTQMLAHDLRRPLLFVEGVLQLVETSKSLEQVHETTKKYGHSTRHVIRSSQAMIADILTLGRTINIKHDLIDLHDLIHSCILVIKLWPQAKGIQFSINLFHSQRIQGDSVHLTRVFENIIANALHFTQSGKSVSVTSRDIAYKNGVDMVEIRINNPDSVIPSNDLSKVFEPFVTRDKKSGTGLGLAICNQIIKQHGGTIACTSTPELGTTFFFTLPVAAGSTRGE